MTDAQIAYKRHLIEVLGIEEGMAESMTRQNDSGFYITESKANALLGFKFWENTSEGEDYWRKKYKEALEVKSQKGKND